MFFMTTNGHSNFTIYKHHLIWNSFLSGGGGCEKVITTSSGTLLLQLTTFCLKKKTSKFCNLLVPQKLLLTIQSGRPHTTQKCQSPMLTLRKVQIEKKRELCDPFPSEQNFPYNRHRIQFIWKDSSISPGYAYPVSKAIRKETENDGSAWLVQLCIF